MKKAILLTIAVLATIGSAVAQYGPQTTYRFLNVPASAKAAALGGMPTSIIYGDPSQMHVNPAFLNADVSGSVSATFARFLGEVDMGFVSGAYHLPDVGTFGASIRYFSYGEFDRIDASGVNDGVFTASDMALKLAYAREYLGFIQYGLAVDLIYSSYEAYRSTGFALSGGIITDFKDDEMSVGLSFVNLGQQLSTYDGVKESLPFDLRLGVSQKLLYLPLRISVTAHNLHRWDMTTPNDIEEPSFFSNLFRHLAIGGEFMFSESFHLRLGYNHYLHDELKTDRRIDLAGFGLGIGINYKSVGVDISRNSYSEMGQLLQLGVRTRF